MNMKKIYKTLIIITILVLIGIGLYIGYVYVSDYLEDKARDRERINSKTLTEYVKTHDYEYVDSSDEALEFYGKDVKCSALNSKNILAFYNDYLILDDYSVYETTFASGKYYSNDEQCKKVETDLNFKAVKKSNYEYIFITEDNKLYNFYEGTFKEKHYFEYSGIIAKDEIFSFVRSLSTEGDKRVVEVLKTNGNLYKQSYKILYENGKTILELLDEEIILSKDIYGNILDFEYSNMIFTSPYSFKDIEEQTITKLITNNGLYLGKYIETEECKKYEDVPCEVKLVKSDIYEKFKDDIKYVDSNFIFTNDNYIIKTNMLTNGLDKEVK